MSDKFRIHKIRDDDEAYWPRFQWAMDYPDGFSGPHGPMGEVCSTFAIAVETFIKASESRCPSCQRGAVVDTEWGWECANCGQYDVAVGCVKP